MAFLKHPYEKEIAASTKRRLTALGGTSGKSWGHSSMDRKTSQPKTHAGTQRPLTVKGGSAGIPSGGKVKHRPDRPAHNRYAKGGKVRKKGHTTNIVIAQHPGGGPPAGGPPPPMPVPVPVGAPPAPPMRPPMGGPGPAPAPMGGPGPALGPAPMAGLRPPGMMHGGSVSGHYALSPEEHYHNWGEGYKDGGHVKKKDGGFLGHEPPPGKTYKGYPHSPTTEEDDAVSPTKRGGHIKKKRAHGGKIHSDEKEDRKLFGKMMKERDKEKHEKRKHGGKVHGGKFTSAAGPQHNWGEGMAGSGTQTNTGTGGKVDKASVDHPKVSAPGASVHMDAAASGGLGRLRKSKMSQSPGVSKTEL